LTGDEVDFLAVSSSLATRSLIERAHEGATHHVGKIPPNADAALHLIREILPRVRSVLPDTECWIVGRNPQPPIRAAADRRPPRRS